MNLGFKLTKGEGVEIKLILHSFFAVYSHRFSLACQVMLSVGGDKRLIHLVVCYIVTRFDLDQQYLGEKSMTKRQSCH